MLFIYTPQVTNRIRFTFDLVFKEVLGIDYEIISNLDEFFSKPDPKICYDKQTLANTLCFGAVYLLFEKGIKDQAITVTKEGNTKIFFQLSNDEYCLPFDPFAASFYIVTRYEEYLPHVKDHFGRFPAKASLAYKNHFLHLPIVNYYIEMIKQQLQSSFKDMVFLKREFNFIPTYDVDSAYAYLNKGFIRNVGGFMKSLYEMDFSSFKDRILVLTKAKKDPFDNYQWLLEFHKQRHLHPFYFFLVGDYGKYDKNISITIRGFRELIKSIADYANVGIHPSFASNDHPENLKKEIGYLSETLKRNIIRSRQHFLRLEIPVTYQRLLEQDIVEDYSMGFASHPGFRAGICYPYYFYNLETENKTLLKIFPFAIMDATLNYYLRLTPKQIMPTIKPIIDEVKKFNGTLVTLWHNSSFSEEKEWVGWKQVYKDLVSHTLNISF